MRWSAASFVVPVAFLSLGSTDCDQFQEVTVPAADSSPPLAVGSAYRGSGEALMHSWERDGGVLHRYSGPPGALLVAAASSIDDGGARRVNMTWTLQHECCRLTGATWSACTSTTARGMIEDDQEGTIGSRVSSGVYVAQPIVEPAQCPTGKRTHRLDFELRVRAWDFRGNQSVSGPHRVLQEIEP